MTRPHLALAATRACAAELGAEWPLALHMLEGHAPRFFAEQRLEGELHAALDALEHGPLQLEEGLDEDAAMQRVDARWLLARRGRAVPRLDVRTASACLEHAPPLHAWLMGELLGVRRDYQPPPGAHTLYWLTHRVLLDTDYLSRPPGPKASDALEALERALPSLPPGELLGEALFCLQRAGRDVSAHVERFAAHQRADGSFDDAHGTAVGLIVLAH